MAGDTADARNHIIEYRKSFYKRRGWLCFIRCGKLENHVLEAEVFERELEDGTVPGNKHSMNGDKNEVFKHMKALVCMC